jgi:hypothetical protein
MVRIIDGEIVADNDPRLRQRSQPAAPGPSGGAPPRHPAPPPSSGAGGVLAQIEAKLGLTGRQLTVPAGACTLRQQEKRIEPQLERKDIHSKCAGCA